MHKGGKPRQKFNAHDIVSTLKHPYCPDGSVMPCVLGSQPVWAQATYVGTAQIGAQLAHWRVRVMLAKCAMTP
jgi:hypothetical protein